MTLGGPHATTKKRPFSPLTLPPQWNWLDFGARMGASKGQLPCRVMPSRLPQRRPLVSDGVIRNGRWHQMPNKYHVRTADEAKYTAIMWSGILSRERDNPAEGLARTDRSVSGHLAVAVHALNRMSELRRPNYVRIG
jgi:hypothetical protein